MNIKPEDERTIEIARRTRKNLEYMDAQHKRSEPVYEFTQLLNSVWGMLICIREEYYKGTRVEWEDIESKGVFPSNRLKEKAPSFNRLVSNTRNAVAHSNFSLIGEGRHTITGIKVWNLSAEDPARHIWEAEFTEQDLRELLYLAVNYLEVTFGMERNGEPSVAHPAKK